MPLIKVTEKGTVTKLYRNERKKMRDVEAILGLLAHHCPAIPDYQDAEDALAAVNAMWEHEDKREKEADGGRTPGNARPEADERGPIGLTADQGEPEATAGDGD